MVDASVLASVQRKGLAAGLASEGLAGLRISLQLAGLEDPMATMYLPEGTIK